MNKNTPKTKEECFAQLDAMLSEENKKKTITDDCYDYQFSLGLWIRNNWLYPLDSEERKSFITMFMDDICLIPHPDETSTVIIEKYVIYLKEKE